MKLNRNSKKWEDIFEERLIKVPKVYRYVFQKWDDDLGEYVNIDFYHPDRIKEAEEYADRLFSAMR